MSESTTEGRRFPSGIVIAVVSILVVGAILVLSMRQKPLIEANAGLVEVAKLASSDRFQQLGLQDRLPYMKRLRQDSKALRDALASGQLSREEFDQAYLNGWMARQIDHMNDYYSMPEAKRARALLAEYQGEQSKASSATTKQTEFEPSDDVKDQFIHRMVKHWTPEEREKWEQFRKDVKAAKSAAKAR